MADTFGAVAFPVGSSDDDGGDPALRTIGLFLQAAINEELGAAWARADGGSSADASRRTGSGAAVIAVAVGIAIRSVTPIRTSHDGRLLPWAAAGLPGRISDISIE